MAPALAVRFDTHVGLGVAKPPVLSDEEMYTQNATALPPAPPEDVPWEGPLSDYEQERHARRKDAKRAQAFAKLHREDPDLQSVRWEARNRVRLVWRPSCAADEEVLAGIDIGLPMMLVLDDGETHRAVVRYIPPRFEIEVDDERMLSVPLELAKRVEGKDGDGPPRHFFESVNATAVRLLDGDGRARMGFAAASGEVGHEQYEVSRWEFERISLEKPLPNVS